MPDVNINPNQDNFVTTVSTEQDTQLPPPITTPVSPKEEIKIQYPPFLWTKTQTVIRQIESQLNSKVIVYFTDDNSSITNNDVDYFFSHLSSLNPKESISLILISNGGSGTAAWRIANMIRNYCQNFNVIVPSRCASAATMLSLSADKIIMSPCGFLTAIDTSLNHPLNPVSNNNNGDRPSVSVDQINRIIKFIEKDLSRHPNGKSISEILFDKIHPIVYGELERTSSLSKLIAVNMFGLRQNPPPSEEVEKIVDKLNEGYPTHSYPIVFGEAKKLGLPVEKSTPELDVLLLKLVDIYSVASTQTFTHFNPGFYHIEYTPVFIESIDRRTFYAISYSKRLIGPNNWKIENDKTKWLSAITDVEKPEQPKISSLNF